MNLYGSFGQKSSSSSRGNDIGRSLENFQRSTVQESDRIQDFLSKNPVDRNSETVTRNIEKAEEYRVKILKTVPTFHGLNDDQLRTAAESLDEVFYKKGDVVIEQDTVGDSVRQSLFVIVIF